MRCERKRRGICARRLERTETEKGDGDGDGDRYTVARKRKQDEKDEAADLIEGGDETVFKKGLVERGEQQGRRRNGDSARCLFGTRPSKTGPLFEH